MQVLVGERRVGHFSTGDEPVYSLPIYQSQPSPEAELTRSQHTKKPHIICPNPFFHFVLNKCRIQDDKMVTIQRHCTKSTASFHQSPMIISYSKFSLLEVVPVNTFTTISQQENPLVPQLFQMHSTRTIWRHVPPSLLAWHRSDLQHSAKTADLDFTLFLTPPKMLCHSGPQLCNKDIWQHLSPYWV